MLQRNNGCSG
jgi:hypothetical protein